MRFSRRLSAAVPVVLFVLLQVGLAHASPGGSDLGAGMVSSLNWWLQTVIAPLLVLVGIIVTAGSFIGGGARQGLMTGLGVIAAGVLCYSGPAILAFIKSAAGA